VGLDPHAIKELKAILQELKAEGCAILISTHMLESAEEYWDTAHIMIKGKFAATRTHGDAEAVGQTLEEQFFEITEGPAESGSLAGPDAAAANPDAAADHQQGAAK